MLKNNMDFSKDWITNEIIKTFDKEKKTKQKEIVTMSKLDLLRLVQKFIKLNENGGWNEFIYPTKRNK